MMAIGGYCSTLSLNSVIQKRCAPIMGALHIIYPDPEYLSEDRNHKAKII